MSETKKRKVARFEPDDIDESLSDWNLIDDERPPRKREKLIKFTQEPLTLMCDWIYCEEYFFDYYKYHDHVMKHIQSYSTTDECFKCYWTDCEFKTLFYNSIKHHISYHAYHEKLKGIGKNVIKRTDLPKCSFKKFEFPLAPDGYICDWEYCGLNFILFHDFIEHMKMHVFNNPLNSKKASINCCWRACRSGKFSCQPKLAEHLRMHTKEKVLACPTCGNLFSNKTKFCDHRRRQLPQELQSYECSQCSKYFPSERLLRDHMRLHINHYKCSMCEMTCPKPSILAKHIRFRHIKDKPFKCDLCDYRGVTKQNLVNHSQSHIKESIFKCSECDFQCRSQYGLDSHCTSSHGKESNIYECHHCQKHFLRGGILTKHLIKVHKYTWPAGHSRFRYKLVSDGIYRLQVVRYETVDVTKKIIKDNSGDEQDVPNMDHPLKIQLNKKPNKLCDEFEVVIQESSSSSSSENENEDESEPESIKSNKSIQSFKSEKSFESVKSEKKVVITIDDVDAKGNIVKSHTIQSTEIVSSDIENLKEVKVLNELDEGIF